jgi:hypothetical protein
MAVSGKQPAEFNNFSGGITDNQWSGEMNAGVQMDNFVITPDQKLISRAGSVVDDEVNSPIPLGNARISRLVNYNRSSDLFLFSNRNVYYRTNAALGGPWQALAGPTGNAALDAGDANSFLSSAEWNRQVFVVSDAFASPVKFYADAQGTYQLRNVGLPALANAPTVSTTATGGTHAYVYGFVQVYTYTVGPSTFEEVGPVTWVTITNSDAPSTTPNTITNIPVLGSGENYDTANVRIQIYRTINNGTNLYLAGEVVNGTTQFIDSVDDTTLQSNPALYTNDGTQDYNPAPKSKFIHITGNVGYYGYTSDEFGKHPYRVHQSVPGNPGFCASQSWVEVQEEVTGIGSQSNIVLLLCKKQIYRLDGTLTAQGQGSLNPVKIHQTAGCVSHASIVEAENFCLWAGNDGFYASDGYQVIKISDHLNTRYQTMLRAIKDTGRIQGRFDEPNRRVIWSVQLNASSPDNDALFVLDLRYGVSPRSTFTTWSGPSFKPSAIEVFNNALYRGDNNGFVFRHDDSVMSDPKVDVSKTPSNWSEETIIWNYTSLQLNFGSAFMRKFVSRILFQAGNLGNTTIAITAYNDQGKKTRELKPIRWRRNFTWGDESFTWGSSDCVWNAEGLIEQWRRFPAGGLRCSYLQLKFSNALGIVSTSGMDGQTTISKSLKTAVLPNLWPSQSVDYFLSFSNDGYQRQFQIQAINNSLDTVTLLDPLNKLPADGRYDWELTGYSKNEPLNLLGYVLHWDQVDQNQVTYARGDDGGNS